MVSAAELKAYIDQCERATGKRPSLRECVEHFDDKKLNVIMALWELRNAELLPREGT